MGGIELKLRLIIVVLVFVFSAVTLSNQEYSIIRDGCDLSNSAVWLSNVRDGNQSVTWANGGVTLSVVDSDGGWSWAKIQKGRLPHGWTCFDKLKEIEFRQNIEASANTVMCRIRVKKVGSFSYTNESFSSVNLLVGFSFQLDGSYDLPINQSHQLNVDFPLIWTSYTGGVVSNVVSDKAFEGYMYDEDKHYQVYSGVFVSESDVWVDIVLDVGEGVRKALSHYRLSKAVLRNMDVLLEGCYGSGSVQVDYVELDFCPSISSGYVISLSLLYGFIALFGIMFSSWFLRRFRRF